MRHLSFHLYLKFKSSDFISPSYTLNTEVQLLICGVKCSIKIAIISAILYLFHLPSTVKLHFCFHVCLELISGHVYGSPGQRQQTVLKAALD